MKNFWVLITAVICCSCENSESDIKALSAKAVQKDEGIKIESFLSQNGVVKARLTAPLMLHISSSAANDTPYIEFPKALHVDFYNDTKTVESKLDAKYGKYFESLNKVYLRDSVTIISVKGDTMLCEDVWWDQNTQKFHSNKKTIVKSPGIPLYVAQKGFEASQDLKTKTFFSGSGNVLTDEGGLSGAAPTTNSASPASPTSPTTTGADTTSRKP